MTIPNATNKVSERKKEMELLKSDDQVSNETPVVAKSTDDINYKVEGSMATFTMLQVLKTQKHYQQALAVLKLLESKNMDADRISKERSEIRSLLSRDTLA